MTQVDLADLAYQKYLGDNGKASTGSQPGIQVTEGPSFPLPQGAATGPGSPATTQGELEHKQEKFREQVLHRSKNDFLTAIKQPG